LQQQQQQQQQQLRKHAGDVMTSKYPKKGLKSNAVEIETKQKLRQRITLTHWVVNGLLEAQ